MVARCTPLGRRYRPDRGIGNPMQGRVLERSFDNVHGSTRNQMANRNILSLVQVSDKELAKEASEIAVVKMNRRPYFVRKVEKRPDGYGIVTTLFFIVT